MSTTDHASHLSPSHQSPSHVSPSHVSHLPSHVLERAARLFKAAGHPERLRLLECLREGEACVTGLAEHLGQGVTSTSNRLQTLAQAGLVVRRREDRHQYYRLADEHVERLLGFAIDHALHLSTHEKE